MGMADSTANTAVSARKPGWRRRQAWTRLLLWMLAPAAAIAGAIQFQPTYVVLDIPVTPHKGVGYFWSEVQLSQLAFPDSWGVLYLRRLVGDAYPHAQGWHSTEDVFTHFDRWLSANGWTYSGNGTPSVRDQAAVPEGRFLTPEQIRRYNRTGDPNVRAV